MTNGGSYLSALPPRFIAGWNKATFADGIFHVMMSYDGRRFFNRNSYVQYEPHDASAFGCPSIWWDGAKLWAAGSQSVGLDFEGTTIEIASSSDGNTFTYVGSVDFGDLVTGDSPEVWIDSWFVDDDNSVHMIAIGNGNVPADHSNFQLYEKHALNSGLTSWSSTTQITGTAFPAKVLDGNIVKQGSAYYCFIKNMGSGRIEVWSSSSLTSGYTAYKTGDWAGWYAWAAENGGESSNWEANTLTHLGGDCWRIYMDPLSDGLSGNYNSETTTGLFGTWSSPEPTVGPIPLQHGNVIFNPFGT